MLLLACTGLLAVAATYVCRAYGPGVLSWLAVRADPGRAALRVAASRTGAPDLQAVYASRGYRPIWLVRGKPDAGARALVGRLEQSGNDDLRPDRYGANDLSRRLDHPGNTPAELAQTDVRFSEAYYLYIADLHTPLAASRIVFTDAAFRPPQRPTIKEVFGALAAASSTAAALESGARVNPLYERYRDAIAGGLAGRSASGGGALLRAGLERMRALPAELGRRFVLVNVAEGRLWMYEGGKVEDSMKVVVGRPDEATPMLAGMIRYAIFDPSWDVPPDLVQNVYAPQAMGSPSRLNALRMDPWTDYTDKGRKLDPKSIDWLGVSDGVVDVGLRQRPGPENFMGAAKFMLPNGFGIYLHDTPEKRLFARSERDLSAGCVRVEDYRRLAKFLYRKDVVSHINRRPDLRVDLPAPVPVYIIYVTAWPAGSHVVATTDYYNRDPELLQEIARR